METQYGYAKADDNTIEVTITKTIPEQIIPAKTTIEKRKYSPEALRNSIPMVSDMVDRLVNDPYPGSDVELEKWSKVLQGHQEALAQCQLLGVMTMAELRTQTPTPVIPN